MDAQIRRLVVAGNEQNGLFYFFPFPFYFSVNLNILDIQLLTDAFDKLKQNFQVNLVQSKDTIGQDIYVLLAESALDVRLSFVFF